jgi:putative transferase (TIGR04331 family)
VADQYWTWGWTEEASAGARLKPMPDPRRVSSPAPRGAGAQETLLLGTSLPRYPYSAGFDRMPLWHRFYDYLKQRERFVGLLPQWVRDAMSLQINAPDFGWGHKERMKARFPGVRFEGKPWQERLDGFKLVVIDHPLQSPLQALSSNVPTLLFWDPNLWPSRPAAKPALEALRVGGMLHDTVEAAAAQAAWILKDPMKWWRSENVQQSRAEFCKIYAKSDPNWAKLWIKAAQEI